MRITVEYTAQIKRAAGTSSEQIEVDHPCTVGQLLVQVAENHDDALKGLIFDSTNALQKSLLLFVGDEQIRLDSTRELDDGETVTILTPISGG